ncbi:hypothetical protein Q5762_31580 [Streptomyces sp. P9(2023)]|uniref:hypothetical protein n=1 Tax=Streptomyces sp. P9(2023) TaxID=3064394 RepID=UPI0028F3EF24|nr:hypothetical protein [Streptomyces sp. P9(2023)]MDT9692786.1 hypothetical protein [Streptomyces sp. P9(2023)]
MPTTVSAVGCGLRDDEIAAALAASEDAVVEHLARIHVNLGLRDRAAASIHAFDCGLVVPGRGPNTRTAPGAAHCRRSSGRRPEVRISVLGPLQAWQDGRPLNLGASSAASRTGGAGAGRGRTRSRQELSVYEGQRPPLLLAPMSGWTLAQFLLQLGVLGR